MPIYESLLEVNGAGVIRYAPSCVVPYIKKCVHTLKRIHKAFTCVVRQIGTITGHEVARVKKVFFFNLRFFK